LPALGLRHAVRLRNRQRRDRLVTIAQPSRAGRLADPATRAGAAPSTEIGSLALLALLSGWLVFASEVVFTHLLALVIGSSAYAFGLILAVFKTCLFVGASSAAAIGRRLGDAALTWGLVAAGAALALTIPLWDELPMLFATTGKSVTSFAGREAMRALAAFLILCVPVTAMGLTFPLLLQRVARFESVGRLVGRLTAINTIGAVLGSLVTGYLVLPWLGSQRALFATALAFVAAGLLTARRTPALQKKMVGAFASVGVVAGALAPHWDLARLTSGSNVYFDGAKVPDEILMMQEDVQGGVTTVTRTGSIHTLYTNGKFQGNTGWEMDAQRLFAHYPSLFVEHYERARVGLGTAPRRHAAA
jgi:spermidine synthase